MRTPGSGELAWNPVTGERVVILEGPDDHPEGAVVAELHVEPGGAVIGEHLHPALRERFEVIEGSLGVKLAGKKSEAGPGDVVDITPGTWHDWWNAGDGEAVVRVTVTPGDRFAQMIRAIFGLALDGRTNAKGMPKPLQLVQVAREFDDVIIFRRPPMAVQRVVFGALGPLAQRRGYRGIYPRYEGAEILGSAEDVREGRQLEVRFGDGLGPP